MDISVIILIVILDLSYNKCYIYLAITECICLGHLANYHDPHSDWKVVAVVLSRKAHVISYNEYEKTCITKKY